MSKTYTQKQLNTLAHSVYCSADAFYRDQYKSIMDDYHELARLIQAGKMDRAAVFMWELDTSVRDYLSQKVFNTLDKHL